MPHYKKYHDIVIKDDKKVSKYLELASAKCMEHYSQTEIIPVIIGELAYQVLTAVFRYL